MIAKKCLIPALFLALFFSTKSFSQADQKKHLDSLWLIAQKNKPDTNSTNALSALQKFYFMRGLFDSSLKYSFLSLETAKKIKNKRALARSYYNIGVSYTSLTRYDSAVYYLDVASSFFKEVNDTELLVQYYNAYASLYNYQSNNTKAIEYMLKASGVLEKNTDTKLNFLLPQILGNIGYLFEMEKQHDKNISYQYKALQYRKYITDTSHFLGIFSNLFNGYINSGQLEQAKKYLDSTALYNTLLKNAEQQIIIDNNYGFYFENKKDTVAAIPYYLKAYQLSDSISHLYFKAPIAGSLAKGYIQLNDLDKAEKFAKISNTLSFELKNYGVVADTYELLKVIEQKRGNYKQALRYFELYKQFADSASTAETKKNVLTLESKYQNQKKEKEIADLTISNTQKQLTVVKRNRLLLIGGISAASLLLILGLFYRNSRHRQTIAEKEQVLQQEQIKFLNEQQQVVSLQSMINGQETERTRIAKDLHDGLGGLFSTVKMYLSTLQHDVPELKGNQLFGKSYELVDNASVEVRRIAHNMMPEVLIKLGLADGLNDMCNNISSGKLLKVTFQAYGMDKRLNASTEIMLYRIIQELLNNIIKHSQATEALVQFNRNDNRLHVNVEDNGRGFNTLEADGNNHAGLETVQSRVDYLDGKLSIESQQGLGTTIMMEFLIKEE